MDQTKGELDQAKGELDQTKGELDQAKENLELKDRLICELQMQLADMKKIHLETEEAEK